LKYPPEQLIRAVERLPQHELEHFVAQIVALRAQRTAPRLGQQETALPLQINAGTAPEVQRRFDALVAKRQGETITPAELTELIQITDEIEQRDAQRVAGLIELAQLRQATTTALMDALGIRPPAYAGFLSNALCCASTSSSPYGRSGRPFSSNASSNSDTVNRYAE
jgi:hypothetical protein